MFSQIADSASEGAMEGAAALNDRYVQYVEARIDTQGQAQTLFQGDVKTGIPQGFPDVSISAESISFGPTPDAGLSIPNFSDSLSSMMQNMMQMPGPMGLLGQLFQFLATILTSFMNTFSQAMLATQAQAAWGLKKMMQP